MSTTLKGRIRNGKVEGDVPFNLPEGTEVEVTPIPADRNDDLMTPAEIERVLAAMQTLLPLEIPEDVASDLDQWEAKINQHGIEQGERGMEHVFR
jgi:hypothetical protein